MPKAMSHQLLASGNIEKHASHVEALYKLDTKLNDIQVVHIMSSSLIRV